MRYFLVVFTAVFFGVGISILILAAVGHSRHNQFVNEWRHAHCDHIKEHVPTTIVLSEFKDWTAECLCPWVVCVYSDGGMVPEL